MTHECDPERALLTGIINQTKSDLKSQDDQLALQAARYLFVAPASGDDGDITTFTGLCAAIQIDADDAAKAIFDQLLPCQQKQICGLLKRRGYNVGYRQKVKK